MFVGEKSRRVKKARKEVKRGRRGEDAAPPEGARPRRKQLGSPGRPGRPPRTPSVLSPVSAGWPGASLGPERQLLLLPAPGDPRGQAVPPTSPPVHTLEERDSLAFIRGSRGATFGHVSTPVTVPVALALATVLQKTVEKPKGHGQPRPGPDDGDPAPPMGGWPGLPHPRLKIRALGTGDMASDPAPPVTSREALGKCVRLPVPQFPRLLAEGDR